MAVIESPKTRKVIYIIGGIVNIFATYLAATELVGPAELTLITALNTFVCGLAGLNTSHDQDIA